MAQKEKPTNFEEFMAQYQGTQEVSEEPTNENKDSLITEGEEPSSNQEESADVNLEEAESEAEATETEEDDSTESDESQDKQGEESEDSGEEDEISFDDWDNDEGSEEEVNEPSVNYSELAKELGFDGIETKDDLAEAITTMKRESDELRTQSETYSTIPDI